MYVKKLKRSLSDKFASRMMFLLELETAFKVVASILNSRSIYARWVPRKGNDPYYLSALTPNMLLTWRANTEVPVRDYDRSDKPLLRLQYLEECIEQWWNFSSGSMSRGMSGWGMWCWCSMGGSLGQLPTGLLWL